ncbi:hypothetical protein [Streptomyces sp. NPDC059278]|uniref:hypothetical protein n=1 Tax=Streptomyces sp. NPDC059278 TaxID=3346801 RepID=UPI0036B102E7
MTTEDHQSPETPEAAEPAGSEPSPAPKGRGRRGAAGGSDIAARLRGLGSKKTAAAPPAKKAPAKRASAAPTTKKAAAKKAAPAAASPKAAQPAKKAATKKAPDSAPYKKRGDWVTPVGAPATMPAEQGAPRALYSARITFTTTEQQRRALEEAKVEDRIDKTARLRAMVALWEQDERLRKRVDKLARTMQ